MKKQKPDMANLKSVRIDNQTTIFVDKSIPDELAKIQYAEKRELFTKENKRFRDLSNPSDRAKEGLPTEEDISELEEREDGMEDFYD